MRIETRTICACHANDLVYFMDERELPGSENQTVKLGITSGFNRGGVEMAMHVDTFRDVMQKGLELAAALGIDMDIIHEATMRTEEKQGNA